MSSAGAERGFSLVSALFVLIVVSLAGAAMLNLVATERRSSTLSLLGTRAYFGAHAGVNWAANKIGSDPTICPAPVTVFNLTEGALAGYRVSVACNLSDHLEGLVTSNVFRIVSTAELGVFGQPDYVSRRLEATIVGHP